MSTASPGAAITKAGPQKAKKSKAKGRKIGRNKLRCQRYALGHYYEINKCRRLRKVLKRNPNDVNALGSLRFNAQALSNRQREALCIEEYME
jgi:hypothetical protein